MLTLDLQQFPTRGQNMDRFRLLVELFGKPCVRLNQLLTGRE